MLMLNLSVVVVFGKIVYDVVLCIFLMKLVSYKFVYGVFYNWGGGMVLIDSYYCLWYNINIGKFIVEMFEFVF